MAAGRWTSQLGAITRIQERPARTTGLAAALASVLLATVAIYFLRDVAPVVSLSVVYLPAVLLISTYWGRGLGLLTSLLSAAAFNFFHLPPYGTFDIFDSRNWVALAAFTIVALVASTIAELARSRALEAERRRRQADLAAVLAQELLLGADTGAALASSARRVAEALDLPSASIEAGAVEAPPRRRALPLCGPSGDQMATLVVPRELAPETEARLRDQVVPTLEALVALAQRRDAMQSELVETEALRRSDDVKTALLRAVSHDLRTPLTAIVAAGHALGGDTLSAEERGELSTAVVGEGTRLAGLVDNLLALSRLQAGRATPRVDWVSVEDLVSGAAESVRDPGVDLRLAIDPDVPELRADAAQLERAIANLLENAARYGGGQPVSVRARRSAGGVLLLITDQGPGIEPAEQERIFEPFYRGRHRPGRGSTGSGGSGLGLAIARGFIEANGGTIGVQSLPGQGTSFAITLPAVPGAEPVTATAPEANAQGSSTSEPGAQEPAAPEPAGAHPAGAP